MLLLLQLQHSYIQLHKSYIMKVMITTFAGQEIIMPAKKQTRFMLIFPYMYACLDYMHDDGKTTGRSTAVVINKLVVELR